MLMRSRTVMALTGCQKNDCQRANTRQFDEWEGVRRPVVKDRWLGATLFGRETWQGAMTNRHWSQEGIALTKKCGR